MMNYEDVNRTIILMADLYKFRDQKEKELEFYRKKLAELENKLFFVKKEVQLTNFIIDMIEREKLIDLSNLFK